MSFVLILTACCSPLVAFLLIANYYPGARKPLIFAVAVGVMMAGLGFGLYNTSVYSDLTRYMAQAMLTQGHTAAQAIEMFSRSHINDTPLSILWFWLIGQTGNAQFYPATIAFVEYTILAYIVADIAIEEGYSRTKFAVTLLFLLIAVPIFDSVSSVRSTPALAVGALAIYLEYCKKKHFVLAMLLYLCSPLIHSVGFITFLVRILCSVSERSIALAVIVGFLLLPGAFMVSNLVDPLFRTFGVSAVGKLQSYVSGSESDYAEMVAHNNFLTVRKWVTFSLHAISLYAVAKTHGLKLEGCTREMRCIIVVGAICAAISMSFAVFVTVPSYARFTYLSVPFLGIALLDRVPMGLRKVRKRMDKKPDVIGLVYVLLFCMYVFLMFVNMSRRVDLEGFAMHLLFGFLGAPLV